MLLNVPKEIPGSLLKAMCEMGHGSELVIADANFPAVDYVPRERIIFLPAAGAAALLKGVLGFFPLDGYDDNVIFMRPDAPHKAPPVWDEYKRVLGSAARGHKVCEIDRRAFYERARRAYCAVVTGECSPYANIILKKGEIRD